MADFYVKSGAGAIEYANRAWSAGEKMVPTLASLATNVDLARTWVWEITTTGTSNAEPTWPATVTQDVTTVTQNGVVWTARKPGFSSGTTANWAFATIYISYATRGATAGDTIYLSSAHSESITGGYTATFTNASAFLGTLASPCRILSVSDAAAPPTALSAGATIIATGSVSMLGSFYVYGLVIRGGVGAVNSGGFQLKASTFLGSLQTYENCDFKLEGTGNGESPIQNQGGVVLTWINCRLFMGGAGQVITMHSNFHWNGGSIISGSSTPTTFGMIATHWEGSGIVLIEGVDFTNFSSSFSPFGMDWNNQSNFSDRYTIRNCKMPASWAGTLLQGTSVNATVIAAMYNCDNGDTNYKLKMETPYGTINQETVVVKTGGASDGTTPISWKMVGAATKIKYPQQPLESPDIIRWNEAVGVSLIASVDIIHDSVTNLKDDEVWVEVQYLGTTGFPLGSPIRDVKANVFSTAADQEASTAVWTTTGLSNPNKQKLSVTFTPKVKGLIRLKVCLAKVSKTIYVDPKPTIS